MQQVRFGPSDGSVSVPGLLMVLDQKFCSMDALGLELLK